MDSIKDLEVFDWPRESWLSSSWRRKRRHIIKSLRLFTINSTFLILIGCVAVLPQGLTQFNDDPYIVKPTPALRYAKEDLTTVLLLKNDSDNHGRFINVRPDVGVLTSTARTFIQEGVTTKYATQVVGTTLDNGRVYAQYLKKSSRILYDGGVVPSVVTSWVGESSIKSEVLLPQSHNDLFDADQQDWQAIDDRLLDQQRHDFVGNIDYVGRLRDSALPVSISSKGKDAQTLSWFLDSSTVPTSNDKPPVNNDGRFGVVETIVSNVAANKVLSIEDLETYTVKPDYENIAYSESYTVDNDDSSSEVLERNPKLIYKQLMLSNAKNEDKASLVVKNSLSVSSAHNLATVTYYGFADFTTVVGDSVIVFSPSTATANINVNAHVTSIKGEATLDLAVAQSSSIFTDSIIVTHDLIDPTFKQENLMQTSLNVPTKEPMNIYTTTDTLPIKEIDIEKVIPLDIPLLISSEVDIQETQKEKSSTEIHAVSSQESSVMLSRPSDEDILRIYNALANAEVDKKKLEITSSVSTTEQVVETSDVQVLGGATTIFFEDDPFTNFVEPIKTSSIESSATTLVPLNSLENSMPIKTTTPSSTNEESESYTIDTTTVAETTTTNMLAEDEVPVTTEKTITEKAGESVGEFVDPMLTNLVIKEIDANDADADVIPNCIRTSQVFLTQIQKTLTQLETVLVTDPMTSATKSEIRQQLQPTFDIGHATKYYCIQSSATQQQPEITEQYETISTNNANIDSNVNSNSTSEMEESVTTEDNLEDSENSEEEQTTEIPLTIETTDTTIEFNNNLKDLPKLEEHAQEEESNTEENIGIDEEADIGRENVATTEENDIGHNNEDKEEDLSTNFDDDDEDEEIELIYKTLYTTYTYLTTFFHGESTSISSHTEVVTNVLTSTLEITQTSLPATTGGNQFTANINENEINPTIVVSSTFMESTKRYMVPSEVETYIRSEEESPYEKEQEMPLVSDPSDSLATFYTTYTYYTTIFSDDETEIMSHTEVITNLKKNTNQPANAGETNEIVATISPTITEQPFTIPNDSQTLMTELQKSTINKPENIVTDYSHKAAYSTISRSSLTVANDGDIGPQIPDLGDLSAITLVTDVRSSSSTGDPQIINHQKSFPDQGHLSVLEDQVSSESNTDTDEIINPSATLLLQTSFTTFTYYTTMYSGDKTNVISRLETMTNMVTEILQASKTINLEEASVPITYFTTFTYWTKLAKEGQITTLSREETISNVVTPTQTMLNVPDMATEAMITTLTQLSTMKAITESSVAFEEKVENSTLDEENPTTASSQNNSDLLLPSTALEPTTYYTTYTYYTTSYEADNTITDSRFETVTNIVTPTIIVTKTLVPEIATAIHQTPDNANTITSIQDSNSNKSGLILYDFKKIIDADGISTLLFTTQIEPSINDEGVLTEVISSTSSLYINEERKNLQSTAGTSATLTTGPDGQVQKQYKTGLVRLIEGTRIANRTTTLYQSQVIGTVIDQRYAQIIESTSSFIFEKSQTSEAASSENSLISPTIAAVNENIQVTQQATLLSSSNLPSIEGSVRDQEDPALETVKETDTDTEIEEERNASKTDEKLRFPFQTKKRPFVPQLKPFPNRSRPQFAPKKNSSATIITRSDFTPTITATPALKTLNRFSSTRRGSINPNSNSPLLASSSRRFGRPNKSTSTSTGSQLNSSLGSPGISSSSSRNRFGFGSASSSVERPSYALSSKRSGATSSIRPSFSRPSLLSAGFPGNSRLRVKPTAIFDKGGDTTSSLENSTLSPSNNSQEDDEDSLSQDEEHEEEDITESTRRQNNPLLRLRRPLNRPQGFTPTRPQQNIPNNAVTQRRNPLTGRARVSGQSVTTTTTTTTQRPRPRTFQRPATSNRPANALFPTRNIFGAQSPALTTEENKDLLQSEEDTNDNDDDSEYDDEDEEEVLDDENNRRRRSNIRQKTRNKREADSSTQNRTNFRNRFRRPKLIVSQQNDEDVGDSTEAASTPQTLPSQRTRSRFGARYPSHSAITTTAAASTTAAFNHRAIRPTRPSSSNSIRAQFTLREKDSSSTTTTTQKVLTSAKRPAFRRPQPPGGGSSTRRLPSSTVSSNTGSKRRLKTFTSNNDSTSSHSRNSVTSRSRPTSNSGRSRSGSTRGDSGVRSRGRVNHDYSNDNLIPDNGGTISVTHVIPAEVTIPVVNGKVTEYKKVITAKTSTEVLGPQQYTTIIGTNGQSQLVLTRKDSSVNYNGATEVTKYVLHETPTTTITFTPTTIRGRKTSFSHVLPSTVYSVELVVSTIHPQISANAPLANILLSQLLLGNAGLSNNNNALLEALGGGLTQPQQLAGQPQQPGTPVTEYKTHTSTYITTVFEGQSTILPITFQGKKILTTIFDTTAQAITATEFITDTIVTTPTVLAQQQQPAVNSLLLQQLLLQQQFQQQQQIQQQPIDPTNPLNAIFQSIPANLQLGGELGLQELSDVSNNIRDSSDLTSEDDDFSSGTVLDFDERALQAQEAQTHKTGRKKSRKNGKNHKRKHNQAESTPAESSVITLYVSGRRPGEFSTVLSTVQIQPDSTLYKREAHNIDSDIDYYNSEGSELLNEFLAAPEIILLDENVLRKENEATESLESIVGDVSQWYSTQTTSHTTINMSNSETQTGISKNSASNSNHSFPENGQTTQETNEQSFQTFESVRNVTMDTTIKPTTATLNSSYERGDVSGQQHSDIDEARYNLATRIMSNGVEVIIASNKTKTPDHIQQDLNSHLSPQHNNKNKPTTLAASTIKNQMMILLLSTLSTTADRMQGTYTQQLHIKLPYYTNHFITKTCLTTYTYRTTYVQDGETTVESREKVISNIATEERNYPKIAPSQTMGVTLTRTPDLAVGIFPTTYLYFNTFKDISNNFQVMTSEHTVINTITGPEDYIAYLLPTAKATPVLETNTYYNKLTLLQTLKPRPTSKYQDPLTKIETLEEMLTEVIVTKSLPPARSSVSVLTSSYYTFDDLDANEATTKLLSTKTSSYEKIDKTSDLDDIHIFATKKYLTTFTYYTTSTILNGLLASESQIESQIRPMSTVFTYHTRVIENVVTDSIPVKLFPTEFVSKMKLELRKQKHQRLVIVTTATLKGGKTLKITAMKMFTTPTLLPLTQTQEVSVNPLETETRPYTEPETHLRNATQEFLENAGDNNVVKFQQTFGNDENFEQLTEELDTLDTLSSEQIADIVEAPKNYTLNPVEVATTTKPGTGTNNLIKRLTALRPMFNAVAGLLQNNFGVGVETTITPLESKQVLNKKLISNTSIETHPIYIPVQKPYLVNGQLHHHNMEDHHDYIPLSLHIQPPLVNEMNLESNDKDNWLMPPPAVLSSHFQWSTTYLPSPPTLAGPRHEQPLHNGVIYIHPGEVITANSDVIVGRPNGIEYVHIPSKLNEDKAINTNLNSMDNKQQHVTYYQHSIQHPTYNKKKSPSPLLHMHRPPQHVLVGGILKNKELNNKLESQYFGLRPPMQQQTTNEDFNKNILKPPPLPPNTQAHFPKLIQTFPGSFQHSIPLQTPSLVAFSPISPHSQNAPTPVINKLTANSPQLSPLRDLHNLYNFNSELKNNEILEIKRIPEVFSTDLNPSPVYKSHSNTGSSQQISSNHHQYHHQKTEYHDHGTIFPPLNNDFSDSNSSKSHHRHRINLDKNVFSHTVDVNVPPLTFNRDHDYPHQQAIPVKGQIQSSITADHQTKYMPLITIPANEQQVQINLTPFNVISTIPAPISNMPNRHSYSVEEHSSNAAPHISKTFPFYYNSNLKEKQITQDQNSVASGNVFSSKPVKDSRNSSNHPHMMYDIHSSPQDNYMKQNFSPTQMTLLTSNTESAEERQSSNAKLVESHIPLINLADEQMPSYTSKPSGKTHYEKFNDNETIQAKPSLPEFGLTNNGNQKFFSKGTERNPFIVVSPAKPIPDNNLNLSTNWKEVHNFKSFGDITHTQGNLVTFELTDTPNSFHTEHTNNFVKTSKDNFKQILINDYNKEILQTKALNKKNDTTRVWRVKQPQKEPPVNPQSYQNQRNDEIILKNSKQSKEKFSKKIATTLTPPIIDKTLEKNNLIIHPNTEPSEPLRQSESVALESEKLQFIHGQPFRKYSYNDSTNTNNPKTETQSAIFVAAGESFKMPSGTESPNTEQDILVTYETKNSHQSSIHRFQLDAQLDTMDNSLENITQQPLAIDIQPPPLLVSISTEPVLGLSPPPPVSNSTTSSIILHKNVFKNSLKSERKKQQQDTRKHQPVMMVQSTKSPLAEVPNQAEGYQRMQSAQLSTSTSTPNSKPKYYKFERPTSKKLQQDEVNKTFDTDIKSFTYQPTESHIQPENKLKYNLQPSQTYVNDKSSSTSLLPPQLQIITTTTTLNENIVMPTKLTKTNRYVYTVTTTATKKVTPPMEYKITTSHTRPTIRTTLKSLTTTETTTTTEILLVTQTVSTTVVDTVISFKTETIMRASIAPTTTLKQNITATEVSSIPHSHNVSSLKMQIPQIPKSNDVAVHNIVPYPSVEIISTNISKAKAQSESLPPHLEVNSNDDNSIFIILSNNKNNSVLKSSSSYTQITDTPLEFETDKGGEIMNEESNEVVIDYDETISFDTILTRDEEPIIHTVNGKTILSNSNKNIGSSDLSASKNHILLLATPPIIPISQQHINMNESNSSIINCRPECKSTRNEVCAMVDDKHWTCICRPGFARMFPDRICKPTYTYSLFMHAERVGSYPLQFVKELGDYTTEHFKQLSQLLVNALDRMLMQSDFRDAYHGVHLTQILDDDENHQGIKAKFLLQLSDNTDEKRLEEVFRKYLRLSNYSIGGTDVYTNKDSIDALAINDFDECFSKQFHDCSNNARCFNLQGTYTCSCREGFADLSDNIIYPGRICSSEQIGCEQCQYHGKCSSSSSTNGLKISSPDRTICECFPWYTGAKCHVNLKILLIVLLGIGTLLFILLLFCCLITCTKRQKLTTMATSTMTSTNASGSAVGSFHKNSRLATNMLITRVGVEMRGSIENGFGTSNKTYSVTSNKRQKSIKIDKRSIIKDSSSETSQNSLPYALKSRESFSGTTYNQTNSLHLSCSQKYSNYRRNTNGHDQHSVLSNNHLDGQDNFNRQQPPNSQTTTKNTDDAEGHYCEQSDRSLTVMIPRAKYHSTVLPQNPLIHATTDNNMIYFDKNTELKCNQVSSVPSLTGGNIFALMPSNPGALISAGFEVSAIVSDHANVISSLEKKNIDLVCLETSDTSLDPVTSIGTDHDQKHVQLDGRRKLKSNKLVLTDNIESKSEYNVKQCGKDLIDTMGEWLGNVKLNELSAEARSFGETTVRASTKPLRVCIDDIQAQPLNDEANTMAERDIGSTFLLPHTHLYKPERQESEMSGFDSL